MFSRSLDALYPLYYNELILKYTHQKKQRGVQMAVSAKDIAKKLDISTSTVSLVLNGKPGIGDETRKKVLETAAKMGYTKRSRRKHQQKKPAIQFIIYKKHGNVVSDTPFFAELIEGVSSQTLARGYTPHILYFYPNQNIEEQLDAIQNTNSQGIILLATEMNQDDIHLFASLRQPIVLLDSYVENGAYDCIVINNEQGAYIATKHLIAMGHKDIGYLHSSIEINNFNERLSGYLQAVRSSPDTQSNAEKIICVESTYEGAYRDMSKYIHSGAHIPKALFADNDIIAASCVRAMQDSHYKIPEDVSIVGFDNMPICELVRPTLTTVHVPKQRLGILAVDRLLHIIAETSKETLKISLSTELVQRDSVLFVK